MSGPLGATVDPPALLPSLKTAIFLSRFKNYRSLKTYAMPEINGSESRQCRWYECARG